MITPDLILKYSLALDELAFETPVPKYSNVMTDERISTLFEVFQKNLPPKKPVEDAQVVEATFDDKIGIKYVDFSNSDDEFLEEDGL
jgi:hypothetical protein